MDYLSDKFVHYVCNRIKIGYEGQNFVKIGVNQCYILILLVWLQKFELFCPGLEYSPHTVVLNQAMDFFQACISFRYLVPKLWNEVPSLDHFVVQNSGNFLWVFLCFKLQTIVSSALILLSSWLLSEVWNIKTPNLSIFSAG